MATKYRYDMQLTVNYTDDREGIISFLSVEAENDNEARELAKRQYEDAHPGAVVHLFHPPHYRGSGSPSIYRVKQVT